jgi:hypothetical protein
METVGELVGEKVGRTEMVGKRVGRLVIVGTGGEVGDAEGEVEGIREG